MVLPVLLSHPMDLLACSCLMAAVASLWVFSRTKIWLGLVFCAAVVAFFSGRVTGSGLVFGGVLGALCFIFYQKPLKEAVRLSIGLLLFLFSLALGAHKIPGFLNWLVLSPLALSSDALPTQLYINFDKPLVGLFFIGFGLKRIRTFQDWKRVFQDTLPVLVTASSVLSGLSYAFGYVRLDLKWFDFSVIWILVNLLFVCVAEEAFFRGFLQEQLGRVQSRKSAAWIATSLVFGLAHFSGGWVYVCLASVAGLFYGYAYMKTLRIEASIGVHFAVNVIHFIAFTYPCLTTAPGVQH